MTAPEMDSRLDALTAAVSHLAEVLSAFSHALLANPAPAVDMPPPSPPRGRRQRLKRLAQMEHDLRALAPGERAAAIQERLSISRATYYRQRTAALESGVLHPVSPSLKRDPKSETQT